MAAALSLLTAVSAVVIGGGNRRRGGGGGGLQSFMRGLLPEFNTS